MEAQAQAVDFAVEEQTGGSLLDQVVDQSRVARSDNERARARDLIGELVSQVL